MAGALRELFALYEIAYDDKGVKRANRDMDGLGKKAKSSGAALNKGPRNALRGVSRAGQEATPILVNIKDQLKVLGIAFGVREVFRGFKRIVIGASDAQETLNVLEIAFGGAQQSVIDFASKTADEIGRSEFQLREFAGMIGAVVTPQLKAMGAEAKSVSAGISNDFSLLAVDLSSAFNTSEEQAIEALRSALTGQTEPLLKFGVVALQQNIAEFAGLTVGQFTKLDQASKVLLRYQFIMDQTTDVQGDAQRTLDGFANSFRALQSAVGDVATTIGQKILPSIEFMIRGMRGAARTIADVIKNTELFNAALILGSLAVARFAAANVSAALATLAGWLPVIVPFLLMAAAVAAFVLVLDDLLTFAKGGPSIFGDLFKAVLGEGALKEAQEAWAIFGEFMSDVWNGAGAAAGGFFELWLGGVSETVDLTVQFFTDMATDAFDAISSLLIEPVKKAFSSLVPTQGLLGKALSTAFDNTAIGAALKASKAVFNLATAGSTTDDGSGNTQVLRGRGDARGNTSQVGSTAVSVTVNGGPSNADTGREVQRAVRKELQARNRGITNAVGS